MPRDRVPELLRDLDDGRLAHALVFLCAYLDVYAGREDDSVSSRRALELVQDHLLYESGRPVV